jgi:hypothetical protein
MNLLHDEGVDKRGKALLDALYDCVRGQAAS